jgi:hypothetical protein
MAMVRVLEAFSARRLGGEPVPEDVKILLGHARELAERSGVELNWEAESAPWLDTSYLTEEDRRNPDIMANVRAIADVCRYVAFIATCDDDEYLGYWRGPGLAPVAGAPLVVLDNEGQFGVCGSTFTEAVLNRSQGEEHFNELRDWLRSLGIEVREGSRYDWTSPMIEVPPDRMHRELYDRYLGSPGP